MKHGTNISFWKFLEKLGRIDIPRIQRDYVQGVKDGTGLKGQRLVDAVLDAAKEGNLLVLDFIYGVINNRVFYPLDGQQRLTLLWLLHWYLAFRCGKLKDEKVKDELKKFTYSTRSSSKQFMSSLLDPRFEYDISPERYIDEQIEARSWFYTGWHNDPTIASMLAVLRRIDEKFPKKSDADIENTDAEDIENIWKRLTGDKSNLLFHYLDLEEYAKPDDLFIKMNARGKLLEPLDNFKSDLIKHLDKYSKYDDEKKEWIRNFNGKWIEIFWGLCDIKEYCTGKDEKSIPHSADSLFYRFICRLFIDRLILSDKPVNKIADSDIWKNLYSAEKGGKYSTLDPFIGKDPESSDVDKEAEPSDVDKKEEAGEDDLLDRSMRDIEEIMNNLTNGVNIISEINKWAKPYWTEENNEEYIPSGLCASGALSNNNRPIFHAIVSFIRLVPIEKEEKWKSMFKAWMRFVWNIHENSESRPFSLTRSIENWANELLTKLESTDQFYERLAGINIKQIEKKTATKLYGQVQEEIEKAKCKWRYRDESESKFIQNLNSAEEIMRGFTRIFYCHKEKNENSEHEIIEKETFIKRYNRFKLFLNKCSYCQSRELLKFFCYDWELARCEIFYPEANPHPEKSEYKDKTTFWINQFRYLDKSNKGLPFVVLKRCLESQYVGCEENSDRLQRLRSDEHLVKYLIEKGRKTNSATGYVLNGDYLWIYNNRKGNYIRIDSYGRLRSKVIKSLWKKYEDSEDKQTYDISKSKYVYGKWVRFKYNGQAYRWSPYEPIIIMDRDGYTDKNDPKDKGEALPGDPIQIDVNNVNYEEFARGLENLASRNDGDKCYHLKVEFT